MPKLTYEQKLKRAETKRLTQEKKRMKAVEAKKRRWAKQEQERQSYEFGVAVRREVRKMRRPKRRVSKGKRMGRRVWRKLV